MRNFIIFLVVIFGALFFALMWKSQTNPHGQAKPTLKVYGASSFIKTWGPGPVLKEIFEKTCDCKVEFIEAADTTLLVQKLKIEGRTSGADLVLGFDQYDLEMATKNYEWRPMKAEKYDFEEVVKSTLGRQVFLPYDWGVLAFLGRKSEFKELPKKFEDLLKSEFTGQISLQDPRTSTPGLQFLLWLVQSQGEENAFKFLSKFNSQVSAFGASWSSSWGLFQKRQVNTTFSYVTSLVATQLEDRDLDVVAFEFEEGHPIQYEFLAIPASCRNCDLAEKFVDLILSKEGQKIVMEKNYMFPAIKGVRGGTLFETLPNLKVMDMSVIPTISERERLLKRWAQLRRSE